MDRMRWISRVAGPLLAVSALMGTLVAPSMAAGPKLKMYVEQPDSALAGEYVGSELTIMNAGTASTSGPITITYAIGSGLEFQPEEIFSGFLFANSNFPNSERCEPLELGASVAKCTVNWNVPPDGRIRLKIVTKVPTGASGSFTNTATVEGGGAPGPVSEEVPFSVGPRGPFAFDHAGAELVHADGSADTQAGSAPDEFTTSLKLRSFAFTLPKEEFYYPIIGAQFAADEHFKDVTTNLPAGLVGNPTTTPLCTAAELATYLPSHIGTPSCPTDSQVGIVHLSLGFFGGSVTQLYNMVPPPGMATELGFNWASTIVLLDAFIRPGDHGISIISRNTTTTIAVRAVDVTVWGSPADESHDPFRSWCLTEGAGEVCHAVTSERRAFLRLPTGCSGNPLQFEAKTNSYEHPDTYIESLFTTPALQGCPLVPFAPGIELQPTGTAADSPTGVTVKQTLQQNSNPEGLQEADLKKDVVTLPEGMALNPSAADGLQACTDTQLHLDSNTPAECPDGSKIGTVLVHTPLLAEPIEGNVFLRTQNSSDPMSGEMYRLVIELRNDARGIDIKIPGAVTANPVTGRLTSTFDDTPQLPFSDLSVSFKAGARAPLTTPMSCQPQTIEADLYSWAEPSVPVHRANSFQLTSGPEGTPCVSQQGFRPSFNAGVSSVQAGGFTPFLATFSRKDADQSMQRISVKMPPGLLGSLIGVPLCPEAQANAGTCSQSSEIGSLTAGAGSGPTPFYVTGGHVYMTGPYDGAPFGLSVVVPAKAGPFDLGTVVVRAKVEVDVNTAQLTVTTDPLPQIVGGVPINLRLVNVTINRPNFTYNPTNCDPMSVSGSMTGGEGAVAHLENHFQVTNCAVLGFKPQFSVSTSAHPTRANGTSLDVKLNYPKAPFGTQANIGKVRVELPKQLPSRLTTLQKACTDTVFNVNPAGCPAASRVGEATATTPIIPEALWGPAYFVSHGGAKFPELVIVLSGYGVTVELHGETFINKAGVTSTTFNTVPDVPLGSFELQLPAGPDSALAANGDPCASKLVMPTEFTAQNGVEIKQDTPISVNGCSPEIRVISHKVAGGHATVLVSVPAPGTLIAGGGGVMPTRRRVGKPGTVRLNLRLSKAEQRFVASHHGRRLRVPIKLSFKPGHGKNLHAIVAVLMK